MPRVPLPFGDYLPDQPAFSNPGLEIADGCIPAEKGYYPQKSFVALTAGTLPGPCLGGGSFKASNFTTTTLAGTATGLYRYSVNGWTLIGSGFGASLERPWSFQIFGNVVIATNGADAPQKFNLVTGAAVAPLGGNPPRIGMLGVVRDFLVGGIINGDGQTVEWSGINNSESWTPGVGQCDYQVFPIGGSITAIIGGEYGLILQESRISLMEYAGGNTIFQFNEISSNVGCIAPRSVAQFGKLVFFLSERGFMMLEGTTLKPIGNEKVDRTFAALANRLGYKRMNCTVDPINKIVIWTVPSLGTPTVWFQYNWTLDRWSTSTQSAQGLWRGMSRGATLEELDAISITLEGLPSSLDSADYLGGDPSLFIVNSANTLGTLTGPTIAATFGFGDVELVTGRYARISLVRPLTDATSGLTLTMHGKAQLGSTPSTTAYTDLRLSGDMPTRETWRYVSPALQIAAGTTWTNAQGLEAQVDRGGKR
jgi:hypothetical protein